QGDGGQNHEPAGQRCEPNIAEVVAQQTKHRYQAEAEPPRQAAQLISQTHEVSREGPAIIMLKGGSARLYLRSPQRRELWSEEAVDSVTGPERPDGEAEGDEREGDIAQRTPVQLGQPGHDVARDDAGSVSGDEYCVF